MTIQYKLQNNPMTNIPCSVGVIGEAISIPFDPENTDYENFKLQINDETATLKTADGVLMTPEEAKAYVATLP